jgi:hypothetical protein
LSISKASATTPASTSTDYDIDASVLVQASNDQWSAPSTVADLAFALSFLFRNCFTDPEGKLRQCGRMCK